MLVARDVEVRVANDVVVLGPVSLEVAPGSLVALMGTSGSGKSTLLQVLAGVAEPSAGRATLDDEATEAAVQALGYVPQRESVHDRLNTREALHYAASLRLGSGASIAERVDAVLSDLGLTQQADTLIRNLSGGERRRAACGLELVGNPPVLLLDEPTSGLDPVLERRLMSLFRHQADHGRAVLVATHATASLDLCDEVIVLDAGRVAYRGDPEGARTHLSAVADRSTPAADRSTPAADRSAPTPNRVAADPHPVTSIRGLSAVSPHRSYGLELRLLMGRYARTLTRDRRTLALALGQAPVIGALIAIVFRSGASTSSSPLDAIELIFLIMTGAIWLGVTSGCREVVKERGLVEREFDVGVRLDVYVVAKALILFTLNLVQVVLLTVVALGLQPLGVGPGAVLEVLGIAILTAWASTAMGLVVSCAARSVDQATGAVPLLLMPQLLLAGGLIPLAQMPRGAAVLANLIYARWSYAGLASAAHIGARLSQYDFAGALGFGAGFFALTPGSAAVILIAFTLAGLLAAVFVLMRRPPVNP